MFLWWVSNPLAKLGVAWSSLRGEGSAAGPLPEYLQERLQVSQSLIPKTHLPHFNEQMFSIYSASLCTGDQGEEESWLLGHKPCHEPHALVIPCPRSSEHVLVGAVQMADMFYSGV